MDIDALISKINSTATLIRKSGIQELLEIIKAYYSDPNDTADESDTFNKIRHLFNNPVKLTELFTALGWLLGDDTDWQIQRDAVETLIAIITKDLLHEDLDVYMRHIFKYLIYCFSASKMSVRKVANQCFHEYLLKTSDFEKCIEQFAEIALNRDIEYSKRRDYNQTLQIVLTQHFANHSFIPIMVGLLRQINFDPSSEKIFNLVVEVLRHIQRKFGEEKLIKTVNNLSSNYQDLFYNRCQPCIDHIISQSLTPTSINENGYSVSTNATIKNNQSASPLIYGFIPENIFHNFNSDKKLDAIEQTSRLFGKLKSLNKTTVILPHLEQLLHLIEQLMEENYNVLVKTTIFLIDVINTLPRELIDKHRDFLVRLLRTAILNSPNGDAIMQKHVTAFSMVLFQKGDCGALLNVLCTNQFMHDQKSIKLRQMSINIIIAFLLKFPSNKFDLNFLTRKVAQLLVDKNKVKVLALECVAVICSNFGQAKLSHLMNLIEETIVQPKEFGVVKDLVHQRLSLHRLPRLNEDDIVIPAGESDRLPFQRQQNYGNLEFENSSSDNSRSSSANPLEKRRPSAGTVRGRAKLPWDQDGNAQKSTSYSRAPGPNALSKAGDGKLIHKTQSQESQEWTHEVRNIKKLNEIYDNSNDGDIDYFQSKSNSNMTRYEYISESQSTSGFCSAVNTSRKVNTDEMSSTTSRDECPTATNSTTVTPRNVTNRFQDTNSDDSVPIPVKPALGRSAGNKRKELFKSHTESLADRTNANEFGTPGKLEHIRNSASKKKAQKIFSSGQLNNTDAEVVRSQKLNNSHKGAVSELNSSKNNQSVNKSSTNYSELIVGKSVPVEQTDVNKKKHPVKSMFEPNNSNQSSDRSDPLKMSSPAETSKSSRFANKNDQKDFNNGIVGVSLSDKYGVDSVESDEEPPNKVVMSNTLRESMSLKRLKAVSNDNSFTKSDTVAGNSNALEGVTYHSAPGTANNNRSKPPVGNNNVGSGYGMNSTPTSAATDRSINGPGGQDIDTASTNRKQMKSVGGIKKQKAQNYSNGLGKTLSASSLSTNGPLTSSGLENTPAPLAQPDKEISNSLALISDNDWERKVKALIIFQSLAQFHPDYLISKPQELHSICLALSKEIKNLRSQVSRTGIQTAGQLFKYLKKSMDPELEKLVSHLFVKAGDQTNSFICHDVETTLSIMIESVSPQRAVGALIQNGSDNRNTALRRLAAYNLMLLCEKLGHSKFIAVIKEMNDRVFPTIAKFSADSNVDTRYFAKRIINELKNNSDFDKMCNKYVPQSDMRNLANLIETIRHKGVGEPPQSSHSAGLGRANSLSRGSSAGNVVPTTAGSMKGTSAGAPGPLSRVNSRSMTRLHGGDLNNGMGDVDGTDSGSWVTNACVKLSSNDFRERQKGLDIVLAQTELDSDSINRLTARSRHNLLLQIIPCLKDINSRVSIASIHLFQKLIPLLYTPTGIGFPSEHLSRLINTIAHNFSSKSSELQQASKLLMKIIFESIESSLLIQPCIEAINQANQRTKPSLVENLSQLLSVTIESTKVNGGVTDNISKLNGVLIRHVIPFIGHILEQNKSPSPLLRNSLHQLVCLTHDIIGPDLLDHAVQRGGQLLRQNIQDLLKQ